MRRHIAIAIALSLPGGSKLLPFLYDIAGTITTDQARTEQPRPARCSQHSLAIKRRGVVPFLHSYPAWLASRRKDTSGSPTHLADMEQQATSSRANAVLKERLGGTGNGDFIKDDGSQAVEEHMGGTVEEVLYETVAGYAVRGPVSEVEHELRRVVTGLAGGVEALRDAPVRRALAGAFGRLEQSQHEAFLRMRAVRTLLSGCIHRVINTRKAVKASFLLSSTSNSDVFVDADGFVPFSLKMSRASLATGCDL